jgi:hypothetical protein
MARFAMTSLAFMLLEVPDPVWKMSTGNSRVVGPGRHLVGGLNDRVRERAPPGAPISLVDARRPLL